MIRLFYNNQKRAQMEIMGLAIIILLIVIGLLFVFKFMGSKPKDELKQEFVDTKLASNMLNVILKTTLDCKDIEIKNLYQDCAEGITNIDYCGDDDPCHKASVVVEDILNNTLKKWGKSYTFNATIGTGPDSVKTLISNKDCTAANIGSKYAFLESEIYPIPTDEGTMLIKLDICR